MVVYSEVYEQNAPNCQKHYGEGCRWRFYQPEFVLVKNQVFLLINSYEQKQFSPDMAFFSRKY
jgi:hypothetical protein